MDELVSVQFSQEQLATLGQALAELPYKTAAPLIAHINAQLRKRYDAPADTSKDGA